MRVGLHQIKENFNKININIGLVLSFRNFKIQGDQEIKIIKNPRSPRRVSHCEYAVYFEILF